MADSSGCDQVVLVSVTVCVCKCFCTCVQDSDMRQAEQVNDLLLECCFFAGGFDTCDVPLGSGNGQCESGETGAGAQIQEFDGGVVQHDCQAFERVRKVTYVDVSLVCDAREVVFFVFSLEKVCKTRKLVELLLSQVGI